MKRDTRIVFPVSLHRQLLHHLFSGDGAEHGAVVAAGLAQTEFGPRLLARKVWLAREPEDYRQGPQGYMGLQATFIHRCITHCRDQRLVYLAVHNHGGAGRVAFSAVDFASHERGYRALLDIADGMPVGALVFARDAVELDLWKPDGTRSALHSATVLGPNIERYYANPRARAEAEGEAVSKLDVFARQSLFLGEAGQAIFRRSKVAIIGLGGIGSLVSEYLARLGVGAIVLIDPDRLETSNISRVIGSRLNDLERGGQLKIEIAARVARDAQPSIGLECIADDFARAPVAEKVLDCDYIFLAADSMRARLVFNAIVQQYYIPGVQLGTKIVVQPNSGNITSAFSVVRQVLPESGCLMCNQLIDATKLAEEWKTDAERQDQQYGITLPNPSVITMNAVAASHSVNDFLFALTGLPRKVHSLYKRYDHLSNDVIHEHPRRDEGCSECSTQPNSRLGFGDARPLPCAL
jgi:hypothetical protein